MNKNKNNFKLPLFKKAILTVFLCSVLSFFPLHKSSAALWPYIDPPYQRMLDTIYDQIKGVILSSLKQQAARIINEQVNKLVGGTVGSAAKFITDWEVFLVTEPQRQANKYMNDYISQTLGGRGSGYGYIPISPRYGYGSVYGASDSKDNSTDSFISEGFVGGKVLGEGDPPYQEATTTVYSSDYYENMREIGESVTSEKDMRVTYEGNPSRMFSDGTFRNFNLYLSGINNPWAFQIYTQSRYNEYLENQRWIASNRAIAYGGYLGTVRNGVVVTPGSTIAQAVANAQDIGNKIISSAQHAPEIIASIVTNVITQALQQGIGAVASVVDRQINQVTDKVVNEVNQNLNKYGPRAVFDNNRRY